MTKREKNNDNKHRIIEILLRVIEVVVVFIGSVYLMNKANDISIMQLNVTKFNSQPNFNIHIKRTKEEILETDSMVVEIENDGLNAENINIEMLPVLVITCKYKNDKFYRNIKMIINNFYYGIRHSNKVGLIESFHDYKSFDKYLNLYFEFLQDEEIDGFVEFNTLIRITYVDIFDEPHIKYYKMNETSVSYLPVSSGEEEYQELKSLSDAINVMEFNMNTMKEIISKR